jgi:CRISPR-associated protein Cmr2
MGQTLRELAARGHAAHQALSRALTGFAISARRIVEQEHRGVLVYAGGDDVLAFVCLPDALECAAGLRRAFATATREVLEPLGVVPPTLSVGLGIGHMLESLGDLLALGRRAEGLAKRAPSTGQGERDGLALVARLHSGREHAWRGRWPDGPVDVLTRAVELRKEGRLPLKKLQEVEALLRRMPQPDGSLRGDVDWGRVLAREVGRVLRRVEAGAGGVGLTPPDVGLVLEDGLPLGEAHSRVAAWAECLWLAELLSRAKPRVRGAVGGAP